MDNDNLAAALSAQIQISTVLIGMVQKSSAEPIVFAKRWGITPEKAQKTIQATTQRRIWTMLHPLLSRRFRTNNRNLYHHPAHPVMMFANTVLKRGNKCEQAYATDFGWARAFSMASRSEAYETLSLLFARDGVLPAYKCDNAKEMVQGKFYQKLKEAVCHLRQLEPYTPLSNAAKRSKRA